MTTEKLTQYHTAPSEFATPTMVYGGAPMMSKGPAPFAAVTQQPEHGTATTMAQLMAALNELATLRADNDARGVVIADLRNAIDIANARADRQAARAERAEAELARQKRVTTLMAKVAREMTQEDE